MLSAKTDTKHDKQTNAGRGRHYWESELHQAALPLSEFLNEHYHPHVYAIVTQDRVEIVEGLLSVPMPVRD